MHVFPWETTHRFIPCCFVSRSSRATTRTGAAGIRSGRTRHEWRGFSPSCSFPDLEFVPKVGAADLNCKSWRIYSTRAGFFSSPVWSDGSWWWWIQHSFSKWLIICCPQFPDVITTIAGGVLLCGWCELGLISLQRLHLIWQDRRCLWVASFSSRKFSGAFILDEHVENTSC